MARSYGALTLRTGLRGADTEPGEPALLCPAHVLSVGLDPRSRLIGHHSTGGSACDRRQRRRGPPALEGIERSGRVNAWRSPDEFYHLLKLADAELGHDLADVLLVEQQNSRDDGFGYTLSGGPSHRLIMKNDSETIRHGGRNIFRQQTRCISKRG